MDSDSPQKAIVVQIASTFPALGSPERTTCRTVECEGVVTFVPERFAPDRSSELHSCPRCLDDHICPILAMYQFDQVLAEMRCGSCEHVYPVIMTEDEFALLERQLDQDQLEILRDARRLASDRG